MHLHDMLLLICSGLLTLQRIVASSVLIQGGTVVNHDRQFISDVLIRDDLIVGVGVNLQAPSGAKVIDATGRYVMPGGIDPHTHLEMPFMGQVTCDDFYSGQAAALAGGTTMHIDFALPTNHDLAEGFKEYQAKSAKSCMDYSFHMAVTKWNDKARSNPFDRSQCSGCTWGLIPKTSADMAQLVAAGINSFKFFMAYKGALMVTDEELLQGFKRCKELGALPMVHAENGDAVVEGQQRMLQMGITGPEGHALSRPAVLEGEATGRAIKLAKFVNVPLYVVHVMSRDAMEEVARARQAGQRVIGEPVASGLALDESHLWHPDFKVAAQYVMSPPIRSAEHRPALKAALAGGVLQLVATDHAVFNSTQKAVGRHDFRLIPNGVNGIEERMHVVWEEMVNSGMLSPSDFVRVTSTAAAQIYNLYPRKGLLAAGSDADVIVLDPHVEHTLSASTHHSRMDTNIYEGKRIRGKVVVTVSRGHVVWENGKLDTTPGAGRFIPCLPNGPLFHSLDKEDSAAVLRPYGKTPVDRDGSEGTKDEL